MPTSLTIRICLWLWLIAAVLVGNFRLLVGQPAPIFPAMALTLTGLVLLAYHKVRALRTWIDALELRALVLLHVTRFVGFYFLALHDKGLLPGDFAIPAGWGDILVATGALLACLLPLSPLARRKAISLWNVVGFFDLMLVVLTLAWLDMSQMHAFTALPLSLLPTFLVPLLLATHIMIYLRLKREA